MKSVKQYSRLSRMNVSLTRPSMSRSSRAAWEQTGQICWSSHRWRRSSQPQSHQKPNERKTPTKQQIHVQHQSVTAFTL